jgi:hypothetical protein
MNGKLNGVWPKILLAVLPLLVIGLVAFGALKSDVRHTAAELEDKADAVVVETQYEVLTNTLERMEAKMDRHLEGHQ